MPVFGVYDPPIGIPRAQELHLEDAAFHRLVPIGLGTRATAEHVSLAAHLPDGGL